MYAKLFLTIFFMEIFILIFSFIGNFPVNENAQFNPIKKNIIKYQKTCDKVGRQTIKKQENNIFMFHQFTSQKH